MNDYYLTVNLHMEDLIVSDDRVYQSEYPDEIRCVNFDLHAYDSEEDKEIEGSIGYAKVLICPDNREFIENSLPFDDVSEELLILWNKTLELMKESIDEFKQVIVLDRLVIEEEFRCKNIGEEFFYRILTILESLFHYKPDTDICLVIASPLSYKKDEENFQEGHDRLFRFYDKLGFDRYYKAEEYSYMARNLIKEDQ